MTKVAMKPVGILMDARYNYGIYWYGPDIPVENTELYVVSPTKRRSSPRTKRKWVGLTVSERMSIFKDNEDRGIDNLFYSIECALKEKNT